MLVAETIGTARTRQFGKIAGISNKVHSKPRPHSISGRPINGKVSSTYVTLNALMRGRPLVPSCTQGTHGSKIGYQDFVSACLCISSWPERYSQSLDSIKVTKVSGIMRCVRMQMRHVSPAAKHIVSLTVCTTLPLNFLQDL